MRWDRTVTLKDLPPGEKGISFHQWAVELGKREAASYRRNKNKQQKKEELGKIPKSDEPVEPVRKAPEQAVNKEWWKVA